MNFSGAKRNMSIDESHLSDKYFTTQGDTVGFGTSNLYREVTNPLQVGTFSDQNTRTLDNSKQTSPSRQFQQQRRHSQQRVVSTSNQQKSYLKASANKVVTELFVWGSDSLGQLGLGHKYLKKGGYQQTDKNGNPKLLSVPKSCSFNIQIREVACGEDFAFLLTKRGLLYAMGSNQFGKIGVFSKKNLHAGDPGQLGRQIIGAEGMYGRSKDSQFEEEIPFVSTPKLVESLAKHNISKVACGLNHAVAIEKDSGVCFSWGCGSHGQLARPQSEKLPCNPPTAITFFVKAGIHIVDAAAGGKHTLFLAANGAVFSAGMNNYGQLGVRSENEEIVLESSEVPRRISRLSELATQVSCGLVHSQVLLSSGRVVSFGDNQFGQLGLGKQSPQWTCEPTLIPKLGDIRKIASNHHAAAIGKHGELYFWGTGIFGTYYEPTVIIESGVLDVQIGGSFGVALTRRSGIFSWGSNETGQLGHNDFRSRQQPTAIGTLKNKRVNRVFCGGSFAILLGQDKSEGSGGRLRSTQARSVPSFGMQRSRSGVRSKEASANRSGRKSKRSLQPSGGSPPVRQRSPFNQSSPLHKMLNQRQEQEMENELIKVEEAGSNSNARLGNANLNQYSSEELLRAHNQGAPLQKVQLFSHRDGLTTNGTYEQNQVTSFKNTPSKQHLQQNSQQNLVILSYQKANHNNGTVPNSFRSSVERQSSENQGAIQNRPVPESVQTRQVRKKSGVKGAKKAKRIQSAARIIEIPSGQKRESVSYLGNQQQSGHTVSIQNIPSQPTLLKQNINQPNNVVANQFKRAQKPLIGKSSAISTTKAAAGRNSSTLKSPLVHKNLNSSYYGVGVTEKQSIRGSLRNKDQTHSMTLDASSARSTPQLQDFAAKNLKITALLSEIEALKSENSSLHAVVRQKNSEVASLKKVQAKRADSSETGKVLGQLTDEVYKCHDLEHLVRKRGQQIEILRGDLAETREALAHTTEELKMSQDQNATLKNENERLDLNLAQTQELLERTLHAHDSIKTQQRDQSGKYEILSNEMNTLRDLTERMANSKNGLKSSTHNQFSEQSDLEQRQISSVAMGDQQQPSYRINSKTNWTELNSAKNNENGLKQGAGQKSSKNNAYQAQPFGAVDSNHAAFFSAQQSSIRGNHSKQPTLGVVSETTNSSEKVHGQSTIEVAQAAPRFSSNDHNQGPLAMINYQNQKLPSHSTQQPPLNRQYSELDQVQQAQHQPEYIEKDQPSEFQHPQVQRDFNQHLSQVYSEHELQEPVTLAATRYVNSNQSNNVQQHENRNQSRSSQQEKVANGEQSGVQQDQGGKTSSGMEQECEAERKLEQLLKQRTEQQKEWQENTADFLRNTTQSNEQKQQQRTTQQTQMLSSHSNRRGGNGVEPADETDRHRQMMSSLRRNFTILSSEHNQTKNQTAQIIGGGQVIEQSQQENFCDEKGAVPLDSNQQQMLQISGIVSSHSHHAGGTNPQNHNMACMTTEQDKSMEMLRQHLLHDVAYNEHSIASPPTIDIRNPLYDQSTAEHAGVFASASTIQAKSTQKVPPFKQSTSAQQAKGKKTKSLQSSVARVSSKGKSSQRYKKNLKAKTSQNTHRVAFPQHSPNCIPNSASLATEYTSGGHQAYLQSKSVSCMRQSRIRSQKPKLESFRQGGLNTRSLSSQRSTKFVSRRLSSKLGESILPALNEVVNYQLQQNDDLDHNRGEQSDAYNCEISEQFNQFTNMANSRVKTPHEFYPSSDQVSSNQPPPQPLINHSTNNTHPVQSEQMHTPTQQQQIQNAYLEAHIGSLPMTGVIQGMEQGSNVVQGGAIWDTAWKKSEEKYSAVKIPNNLDVSSHLQEFQQNVPPPQPIITETASPIKRIISGRSDPNPFQQQNGYQQVQSEENDQNHAARFGPQPQNGFEMQESMIQQNPLLTLSANEAGQQSQHTVGKNQQFRNNHNTQNHQTGYYEDYSNNGYEMMVGTTGNQQYSDQNRQRKSGALKVSQLVGGQQCGPSQYNEGDLCESYSQEPQKLSLNQNPNLVAELKTASMQRRPTNVSSPHRNYSNSSTSPSPNQSAKRKRRSKTNAENRDQRLSKEQKDWKQSRQQSVPSRTPLINMSNQNLERNVQSRNGTNSVKQNQTTGDSSYHLEDYLVTNKSFQGQNATGQANLCSKSVKVSSLIPQNKEDIGTAKTAQTRKRDTIDKFKSKLSRLEQNRADLEQRMRIFDMRVKAHQVVSSSQSHLLTASQNTANLNLPTKQNDYNEQIQEEVSETQQ